MGMKHDGSAKAPSPVSQPATADQRLPRCLPASAAVVLSSCHVVPQKKSILQKIVVSTSPVADFS
jgi:hypothetical protein